MTFAIEFTPGGADEGEGEARIVLGDFEEHVVVPLLFWDEEDYRRQWLEGARRIVGGAASSCLVTEMNHPLSQGHVRWWSLHRLDGRTIAVQEHLHLEEEGIVDPADPYAYVGEYEASPFERRVTLDELRAFVEGAS